MTELADYTLDKAGDTLGTSPPPGRQPRPVWIAAALVVFVLGAAAYIWFDRTSEDGSTADASAPPSGTEADRALGTDPEPIVVPPLTETDPLVRTLVGALSSHPTITAWLATNGLIRNFVVVVDNIADGVTPARHLRALRPAGTFGVVDSDEEQLIDPRSYARYNVVADAVASVDPSGAARLYSTLKPRIEEAYGELGNQEPFDRALERALLVMLRTPVVSGDVAVEETGATQYRYVEPRLEQLNAAHKQLLRMGPRNVSLIQQSLRRIARALGIPESRVP